MTHKLGIDIGETFTAVAPSMNGGNEIAVPKRLATSTGLAPIGVTPNLRTTARCRPNGSVADPERSVFFPASTASPGAERMCAGGADGLESPVPHDAWRRGVMAVEMRPDRRLSSGR